MQTKPNPESRMLSQLYTPDSLRTWSGQFINLTQPDYKSIFAIDIAIGLARAPRFGGHTKKFYSVAEHAMWCMQVAEDSYPEYGFLPFKVLLHDAHEFLLCDVGSPFKKLIPNYEIYAQLLQDAVHKRFDVRISNKERELITEIDKRALEWEWANKVLRWTGLLLDDKSRIDLFIHHLTRLCKTPIVLQP